jgi:hypothetical protein
MWIGSVRGNPRIADEQSLTRRAMKPSSLYTRRVEKRAAKRHDQEILGGSLPCEINGDVEPYSPSPVSAFSRLA